ncbi:hypothetical protein [Kitasatospora cathayae]|uniref:Uncharacterized protein n=1 Tax=Kitasatospora cathayae TaxID=3004092 RepID=A0ABY7QC63_9ACTN|nr:hypothetical protein [Kitasatospora sp. HUAS 3-15]WBP90226.1 hypothetical protein O1G21_33115 [Kitasatospora sp. HUAS 3-15]
MSSPDVAAVPDDRWFVGLREARRLLRETALGGDITDFVAAHTVNCTGDLGKRALWRRGAPVVDCLHRLRERYARP